jgi:hypothetical protein
MTSLAEQIEKMLAFDCCQHHMVEHAFLGERDWARIDTAKAENTRLSPLHDELLKVVRFVEDTDCDCGGEWDREGSEPGPCERCEILDSLSKLVKENGDG